MHFLGLLLLLFLPFVLLQRHVIQLTSALRQQGFTTDIDLGEIISEAVADSPEACRTKCETNAACQSVMLVGQLCRMFAPPTCPVVIFSFSSYKWKVLNRLLFVLLSQYYYHPF